MTPFQGWFILFTYHSTIMSPFQGFLIFTKKNADPFPNQHDKILSKNFFGLLLSGNPKLATRNRLRQLRQRFLHRIHVRQITDVLKHIYIAYNAIFIDY